MRTLYLDCYGGMNEYSLWAALVNLGTVLGFQEEQLVRDLDSFIPWGCSLAFVSDSRMGTPKSGIFKCTDTGHLVHDINEANHYVMASGLSQTTIHKGLHIVKMMKETENKIYDLPRDEGKFVEQFFLSSLACLLGALEVLHVLPVDQLYCSAIPLGYGMVSMGEQMLPVPTPATMGMLHNIPVRTVNQTGNLVTFSGMAMILALAKGFALSPMMNIKAVGYGTQYTKEGFCGDLRVLWGKSEEEIKHYETIQVLETSIDDMNPQYYGHVMKRLFDFGVLDVYMTSLHMKKNRPGHLLTVLCRESQVQGAARILFEETTTLGLRVREEKRIFLPRFMITVETIYGPVRIKVAGKEMGEFFHWTPEYEDCRALADNFGLPLQKIYLAVYQTLLSDPRFQA